MIPRFLYFIISVAIYAACFFWTMNFPYYLAWMPFSCALFAAGYNRKWTIGAAFPDSQFFKRYILREWGPSPSETMRTGGEERKAAEVFEEDLDYLIDTVAKESRK